MILMQLLWTETLFLISYLFEQATILWVRYKQHGLLWKIIWKLYLILWDQKLKCLLSCHQSETMMWLSIIMFLAMILLRYSIIQIFSIFGFQIIAYLWILTMWTVNRLFWAVDIIDTISLKVNLVCFQSTACIFLLKISANFKEETNSYNGSHSSYSKTIWARLHESSSYQCTFSLVNNTLRIYYKSSGLKTIPIHSCN